MPAGMQNVEGQLPGPPALRSAVMSSQIFLYSGVSGGWPASGIQLFGLPGPRTHCPLKFGYFASSTWAVDGVASSAAANAMAQNKPRSRFFMGTSSSADRRMNRAFGTHVVGHRRPKEYRPCAMTIHPPPVAVEGRCPLASPLGRKIALT